MAVPKLENTYENYTATTIAAFVYAHALLTHSSRPIPLDQPRVSKRVCWQLFFLQKQEHKSRSLSPSSRRSRTQSKQRRVLLVRALARSTTTTCSPRFLLKNARNKSKHVLTQPPRVDTLKRRGFLVAAVCESSWPSTTSTAFRSTSAADMNTRARTLVQCMQCMQADEADASSKAASAEMLKCPPYHRASTTTMAPTHCRHKDRVLCRAIKRVRYQ